MYAHNLTGTTNFPGPVPLVPQADQSSTAETKSNRTTCEDTSTRNTLGRNVTLSDLGANSPEPTAAPVCDATQQTLPLNRIAEVREQQGISIRSASRRMGISVDQVRRQEQPDANLSLEDLYLWQSALEVPVGDLLVEHDAPLSGPVLDRARMLRLMKTARAIGEANVVPGIGRMVTMLESQLLEMMPELQEVSAWHSVGQRRTQDEVGRIGESPVSENFARDALS